MTDTGWSYPGASTYRATVQDLIDKKLAQYAADHFDLKPFMGDEKSKAPIVKKTQFTKEAGDKITIAMQGYLNQVPYLGDRTIEATGEEALLFYDQQVYINQMRNAVRDKGRTSRQRSPWDVIDLALNALGDWYARELTRQIIYAIYYGWSPNVMAPVATYEGLGTNSSQSKPCRYWYMGDESLNPTYSATDATWFANIGAAEGNLVDDAAHRMCPAIIDGLAARANVLNIQQATVNGMSGWFLLMHPYQTNQLRRHSDWFQAMSQAMPRGKDNPLFTYSKGLQYFGSWSGVHMYECKFIHSGNESRYNDAYSIATIEKDINNANVYRAILLGANAAALAVAQEPQPVLKDDFDYYNIKGREIHGISGAARAEYISDDGNSTVINQGSIVISTYSPATVIKGD